MARAFGRALACVCMASLMLLGAFIVASPFPVSAVQEGDFLYDLYGLHGSPTQANVTGYVGPGGAVVIPSTLGGFPTAVIDDYSMQFENSITSITIPSSVNTIGFSVFYHCDILSSITVGSGVGKIGDFAFYACPTLTSINFLGLVAPTSVGGEWIGGYMDPGMRGHAYAASNFPPPGGSFNGLTMGDSLPQEQILPGAPRFLSASGGPGFIQLHWSSPGYGSPSFSRYDVYRSTVSGSYGSPIDSVSAGTLAYNDSTVASGTQYFYVVRAVNMVGSGPASNEASATATEPPTLPSAPRALSATARPRAVLLAWLPPALDGGSAITGYMVYRGTSSGGESLRAILGPDLSFLDEGLNNGQTYYYQLSAINGVGEGQRSGEVSASPCTTPAAPVLGPATAGNGSVSLAWAPPGDDGGRPVTNYMVYRGTAPGTEALLTVTENVLEYTDAPLDNGIACFYQVSAVNSVGEGARSGESSATPSSVPTAPRGLQVVAGDGKIDLNWTIPEYVGPGPLTYHLFRNSSLLWSGTAIAYHDSALVNGVVYSYSVAASNSLGWGGNTTTVQSVPQGPPSAPSGLAAAQGQGFIDLTWHAPAYLGPSPVIYHLFRDGASIWNGTILAYLDASLEKGVEHSYTVAASNPVGWGPNSSSVQAEALGPPDVPAGLTAAAGDGWVQLEWTEPSYVGPGWLTYHLLRDGAEIWNGSETGFTDRSVVNGIEYHYSVAASNPYGRSPNSEEVSALPLEGDAVPSLARGLTAIAGASSVALNWTAPSYLGPGEITYHLFRDGSGIWSGDAFVYLDTPLDKGIEHQYSVAVQNSMGWGQNCTAVSATPFGLPDAPWNLSAIEGDSMVALSWNEVNYSGPGALVYHLYRDGDLIWNGIATASVDAPLTKGVQYSYCVSASNDIGFGPNCSAVLATPFGVPDAPWGLIATSGDGRISLGWDSVNY
ncbi:MAG: fibronectin type III domain-containing protein, partial [Methanomassiliicoccales archaeon]|nr:fibronectin type III domain-containing protein [Methanomassiliicoccales archaeon]